MASFKSRIIRLLKNIVESAERDERQQAEKKSASGQTRGKSLIERLNGERPGGAAEGEHGEDCLPRSSAAVESSSNRDAITALPPSSLSKISTSSKLEPNRGEDFPIDGRPSPSGISTEISFNHDKFLIDDKKVGPAENSGQASGQNRDAMRKRARDQARHSHSFDFLPETQLFTGSSEVETETITGQWQCTSEDLLLNTSRETEETFRKAAEDTATSPAQLAWLATLVSPEVRVSVAGNEKTPAETLRKLANDADNTVRLAVASNQATPIDVLRNLLRDSSKAVSIEAETSLAAKGDVTELEKKSHELLATNRFNSTSNSLVASYTTLDAVKIDPPSELKPAISADGNWNGLNSDNAQRAYIQQKDTVKDLKFSAPPKSGPPKAPAAASIVEPPQGASPEETLAFYLMLATKLSTPPAKLAELAKHESVEVRAAVAENVSTPAEGFALLSQDSHSQVKLRVLDNSACPISVIEALCEDNDPYVAYEAKNQYKRLNINPSRSTSERFI